MISQIAWRDDNEFGCRRGLSDDGRTTAPMYRFHPCATGPGNLCG
ncbi:hypothetical protein [Gordonia polyisoprenivorans]|nr:hypothetical protein [Gordonia polyisoprenivorans]WCB37728.1 hypothetical protein PHA63_00745 [Gordonia polyisoprenivorans]